MKKNSDGMDENDIPHWQKAICINEKVSEAQL